VVEPRRGPPLVTRRARKARGPVCESARWAPVGALAGGPSGAALRGSGNASFAAVAGMRVAWIPAGLEPASFAAVAGTTGERA